MIDTHLHLYDEKYSTDLPEVIARSQEAGVKSVYMPNLSIDTIAPMLQLESDYPDFCHAMIGLHPCEIGSDYKNDLTKISQWLRRHPFVGMGEIGLDFYHSIYYKNEQLEAFQTQLQWAEDYQLPVSLHARNSLDEVIHIVSKYQLSAAVFHCFTGTLAQAEKIVAQENYLGLGGIITFPKNALEEVIRNIPLAHLVVETDGPYLSPAPYRGKRNEPAYLLPILQRIADIKALPLEEVIAVTTENAEKIFVPLSD